MQVVSSPAPSSGILPSEPCTGPQHVSCVPARAGEKRVSPICFVYNPNRVGVAKCHGLLVLT